MNRLVPIALVLALAGCGSREPLMPAQGAGMPPVPADAQRAPTTEELLTPTTLARPDRVDEQLRRSEPRQDDRFDLPPAGEPSGVATLPIDDEAPD